MTDEHRSGGCGDPARTRQLTAFCFDSLAETERLDWEAHLLDCDECWNAVQVLDRAVQALRADPAMVEAVLTPDTVLEEGLASRLKALWGGHGPFVLIVSALYAMLPPLALFTEIAYRFDRHARLAFTSAPLLFVAAFLASLAGCHVDQRLTAAGRPSGLLAAGTIHTGTVLGAALVMTVVLPSHAIVQAGFQTCAAPAGFLRTCLYGLVFMLAFVAVPFHAILALQRELATAGHQAVLAVLHHERDAVAPSGAIIPSPRVLGLMLVAALVASAAGTAHLTESLQPGRFTALFTMLVEIRLVVLFVLALLGSYWYVSAVNSLKRECRAMAVLAPDARIGGEAGGRLTARRKW